MNAGTVAIKTIGCKLNRYDSEAIRSLFEQAGYLSCPFEEQADVYVINSCTVTAQSDRDSRRLARQAARRNPAAFVIVTGCYAQREPDALASLPGVSAVVGNEGKWTLPDLVNGKCGQNTQASGTAQGTCPGFPLVNRFTSLTRALLKIQDGCDEKCAYCVVPLARGPSRSRPLEEVLAEARQLIASGHQEIVLVGVHLGDYGKQKGSPGSADPAKCVRELLALPGLGRLRLSSLEPTEVTPEIVYLLAQEPKLCRHLHLPLQSGDDEVLRRMNRRYRRVEYAEVVNDLVRAVPGIAVGADVIVGFPGETEREFRNTCDFIERLPLAYLHVFSYSRRPGTAAASMSGQVPEDVKKRRCCHIRALSERKRLAFRRRLLGTNQTILLEKGEEDDAPAACGDHSSGVKVPSGLTDNYVRVCLPAAPASDGLLEVEVTSVDRMIVKGRVVSP